VVVWFIGNNVAYINKVTLHQAGLVLGWIPSWPTQPGHPSVGRHKVLMMVAAIAREEQLSSTGWPKKTGHSISLQIF